MIPNNSERARKYRRSADGLRGQASYKTMAEERAEVMRLADSYDLLAGMLEAAADGATAEGKQSG